MGDEMPTCQHAGGDLVVFKVRFSVVVPIGCKVLLAHDGSPRGLELPDGRHVLPNAALEVGEENVMWKDGDLRREGFELLDYLVDGTGVEPCEHLEHVER